MKGAPYLTQQCKHTLKMALTAHNALRDHVPFRALYTTLPVKVRHLMGKWGHYRRKVKFNLIIIIFGQVRRAGLKKPNGIQYTVYGIQYTARGPYFAHVCTKPTTLSDRRKSNPGFSNSAFNVFFLLSTFTLAETPKLPKLERNYLAQTMNKQ